MKRSTISPDREVASSASASEHERLSQLLEQALELPPEQRDSFIAELRGNDAALREELVSLLQAHDEAGGYLDHLSAQIITPALQAISGSGNDAVPPVTMEQLQEGLALQYRIERELGGAGMSRVFVAEELRLKRRVVIKVLPPEMVPTFNTERFQREIELAAQLQHPHIVPLLTTDTVNGTLYYTMPFVTGESLRHRLARDGALALDDALRIWRDTLDALAHAHASGVIHCDIKPGNILLSGRNALVADFGIALAIETAGADAATPAPAIGTPVYMAPEQIRNGAPVDHRVDLYATGVVMYETLMGHSPFTVDATRELLAAQRKPEPLPLTRADVPEQLAALVMSCLAEDPAVRPQSAEALLAALDACVASAAVVAPSVKIVRRSINRIALTLLSVAAVAFAVSRMPQDGREGLAFVEPSIAVWPLASPDKTPDDASFAAGMTQELTGMLGRSGKVRVVASSFRRGQVESMTVQEARKRLNVSYILEGVVQKNGSRVHLELRLVDTRDGSIRRTKTYDREVGDIFAVLDDVARVVARALDVPLPGGYRHPAALRYTPNPKAIEPYLQGMYMSEGAGNGRREEEVEYFKQAIEADSNFAAAWAGLAHRYIAQGGSRTLAEQAALKAVALDDSLGHAHSALGWVRMGQRRYADAEDELKKAIKLDPYSPRAFEGLARIYMSMGQPLQQMTYARAGSALYPGSVSATRELALAYMTNGECDKALEVLLPLKDLDPPAGVAGVIRGQCYAVKQMWPEAIDEFRWSLQHSDAEVALAMLGYALARGGQRDEATRILHDLLSGRKDSLGPFGVAVVYAGLRDYDNAFTFLDKAVDKKTRPYIFGPMFEDLQRDPRFQDFKSRLGL